MARDLVIKISGDASNYKATLGEAVDDTEEFSLSLEKVGIAGGAVLAALSYGVYESVKALNVEAVALDEVNLALQNQGIYTADLAKRYRDLAEEIEKKSGIDADAVSAAQAQAQAIVGQIELTEELQKATIDFAARTKTDLATAYEYVARGIAGNVRGLQQFGIQVEAGLTKTERAARIQELLKQKYDGSAEAIANATGSTKLFTAAAEDAGKELGKRFAPTFDLLASTATSLLRTFKENKAIVDFTASLVAGGIAAGGAAVLVVSLVKAFETLKAIQAVVLVSTAAANSAFALGTPVAVGKATFSLGALITALRGASLATKTLVGATGIGLLVVLASEIYLNWSTIFPRLQNVYKGFVQTIFDLGGPLREFWEGLKTLDTEKMRKAGADAVAVFKKGWDTATASVELKTPGASDTYQDPNKKKEADAEAAREAARQARELATKKAQLEVLAYEEAGASKALIDLKKDEAQTLAQIEGDKNAQIRGLLELHLAQVRARQQEQIENDKENRQILNEELLVENEEFQALSEEQKRSFMERNQQIVEQQILNERTAKEKAILDQLKLDTDARNRFLLDQQKFGTAYALINKAMHSAVYEGSKTAFGELAALQQSSNSTLKAIGKTAAIANIIIRSAESAMNIYAGFSAIPIIGPVLGAAGAAAAIAFGFEQIGRVNSAASGALVEGGVPGRDSVPYLLTPGELVVPKQNFEDVIGSTRAAREADRFTAGAGSDNSDVVAALQSIDDKLSQTNRPSVVVQGDVLSDDAFIDRLLEKISDRLQYGNGKLWGVTA